MVGWVKVVGKVTSLYILKSASQATYAYAVGCASGICLKEHSNPHTIYSSLASIGSVLLPSGPKPIVLGRFESGSER